MGRYVRMEPEVVFGQSETTASWRTSFPLVVIRQVLWNIVGPPAPVIRKRFKGGWGRGFFGLGRGVRR